MIDYFALALGHGLLALALLRLALRGDVDADPLIASLEAEAAARRKHPPRGARRSGRSGHDGPAAASHGDGDSAGG